MHDLLNDPRRILLGGGTLAVAALIGWGSTAYVSITSSQRVSAVTAERDTAVAEHRLLVERSGQLAELEAKAAAARAEYSRAVQGLADVKAKTALAQQELASLARRVDVPSDRVTQTGSIRQPEPPKRPAR